MQTLNILSIAQYVAGETEKTMYMMAVMNPPTEQLFGTYYVVAAGTDDESLRAGRWFVTKHCAKEYLAAYAVYDSCGEMTEDHMLAMQPGRTYADLMASLQEA